MIWFAVLSDAMLVKPTMSQKKMVVSLNTLNYIMNKYYLRAESARAVTGRQCPHSRKVEDFLTRQPVFFFTKTAVTRERKVKKMAPKVGNERSL